MKNDPHPFAGSTSEDRLSEFAAEGTPEELESRLLSAFPCFDDSATRCQMTGPDTYGRSILVKHEDGSLEVITLYVVGATDGSGVLTDSTGKTYSGGLDDFRAHNDLLSSNDWIWAPRDITAVPGEGRIVTVTGHTSSNTLPWLLWGIVVVLVLSAGIIVAVRLRSNKSHGAT